MDIHLKIKEIRQRKNFSQSYMAEKMNIALLNYGKLERGVTELSVKRLYEIAEILEVNVAELLGIEQALPKGNADYLKRIEELEDRIKDKNSIISKHENTIKYILSKLTDDMETLVNFIARKHNLVNVEFGGFGDTSKIIESKDYVKGMLKGEYSLVRYLIDKTRVDELLEVCVEEYGLDLFAELVSNIKNEDFDTYPMKYLNEVINGADFKVWEAYV